MTSKHTTLVSLTTDDADALRAAARELDAAWMFDELRGKCDGYGGAEYQRVSAAPRLREIADKVAPSPRQREIARKIEVAS